MGSRLAGAELKRKRSIDMLSSGVIPGTIQVPPSGQPIILMGDAQTTGGYPRIGRGDSRRPPEARAGAAQRQACGWCTVDMADGARPRGPSSSATCAQVAQGLAAAGWPGRHRLCEHRAWRHRCRTR